nr:hypothetical protein [Pseudomonas sp.]
MAEDRLGGQVDVYPDSLPASLASIKEGRLSAIAIAIAGAAAWAVVVVVVVVAGKTRAQAMPNVPTFAEALIRTCRSICGSDGSRLQPLPYQRAQHQNRQYGPDNGCQKGSADYGPDCCDEQGEPHEQPDVVEKRWAHANGSCQPVKKVPDCVAKTAKNVAKGVNNEPDDAAKG